MNLRTTCLASAVILTMGAGSAVADSTFCQLNYAPGTPGFAAAVASGIWLCADSGTTGAVGWGPTVSLTDSAGADLVAAAQTGSAGGVFEAVASAGSVARPGLLRAQAYGEAFAPYPNDGISFARANGQANATIYESGDLDPTSGAAPGTPVALRLTIDVHGAFGGTGVGDGQVIVFRNGFVHLQRSVFVSLFGPSFFSEIDLLGFEIGDEVAVWMRITASAGGTNAVGGPIASVADMSNSGEFFLDVLSTNAIFASTSGYDYRTVPEPTAANLLGAGGLAISLAAGWRRRSRVPRR